MVESLAVEEVSVLHCSSLLFVFHYPGGAAYGAGVRVGDKIVKVNVFLNIFEWQTLLVE